LVYGNAAYVVQLCLRYFNAVYFGF
jgi:hypothetical protein